MAKSSGLGAQLYVDANDFSGDVGSLENAHGGPGVLDVTGIDKSAHERIGGLLAAGMQYRCYFNPTAAREHAVLSTLPTTDRIVAYLDGQVLGNVCGWLKGPQLNYDPKRGADGSLVFDVTADQDGFPLFWGQQHTAGKATHTGATNGTGVDGGTQAAAVTITSSSVANPTVITTAAPHGLVTGDSIVIAGHTGSTPSLNNNYTVTVTGASTFTVPVNVTVGGTGGTMTKTSTNFGATAIQDVFSVTTNPIIGKIQDSMDDVTYADVTGLTFTSVAAAGTGSEQLQTATTAIIRRYTRYISTGTFGVAVVFAGLMRHLTSTI